MLIPSIFPIWRREQVDPKIAPNFKIAADIQFFGIHCLGPTYPFILFDVFLFYNLMLPVTAIFAGLCTINMS